MSDDAPPIPPAPPKYAAVLRWTDRRGRHEQTIDRHVTLGSVSSVEVFVDHRQVAELHLAIEPRAEGLWLRDLGSHGAPALFGNVRIIEGALPDGSAFSIADVNIEIGLRPAARRLVRRANYFGDLFSQTDEMMALYMDLTEIAEYETPCLLIGEPGAALETVARAIHRKCWRGEYGFASFDCRHSDDPAVLEAKIFGSTRSASGSAKKASAGVLGAAGRGVAFIDAIELLPLALQRRLADEIEQRHDFWRGRVEPHRLCARVIAGTSVDLREAVNRGAFDRALYFALSEQTARLPPIRERAEDIPFLIRQIAERLGRKSADDPPYEALVARPWLLNEFELQLVTVRALRYGWAEAMASPVHMGPPVAAAPGEIVDLTKPEDVRRLIARHHGDVIGAAERLGVAPETFRRVVEA